VPTVNGDAQLLHLFGAGTPPRDAQALRASGGAQAWIYRDRMYVRARGSLLNPPHEASAEAADGYRVFQLARPSARLLAEGPDGSDVTITVDF
jgi:intracellular multiplication protein IcmK